MEKLIERLLEADKSIKELKAREEQIPTLEYYKKYGGEVEMMLDLEQVRQSIRDFLSLKFTILEEIQKQAEIMKTITSYDQRIEVLKKPREWSKTTMN